jgi:hypothetical protein
MPYLDTDLPSRLDYAPNDIASFLIRQTIRRNREKGQLVRRIVFGSFRVFNCRLAAVTCENEGTELMSKF